MEANWRNALPTGWAALVQSFLRGAVLERAQLARRDGGLKHQLPAFQDSYCCETREVTRPEISALRRDGCRSVREPATRNRSIDGHLLSSPFVCFAVSKHLRRWADGD